MEKKASSAAPDKGKGRAKVQEEDTAHAGLVSRIATSGTGLAKALLGGSEDAHSSLASGSSLGGKASATRPPETGQFEQLADATGISQIARSGSRAEDADGNQFRSRPRVDLASSEEFDRFASGHHQSHDQTYGWKSEFQSLEERDKKIGNQESQLPMDISHRTDYDDGAEVRELLADPSFNIDTPFSLIPDGLLEPSADDLFREPLFPETKLAADSIRANLPAPPVHKPLPTNHYLNFDPESLLGLDADLSTRNSDQMITPTSEQRERILSDWEHVLSSYTDEVWGDQLPAIRAARSQIEAVRTGTQSLDSKAVMRLQLILGHVKGSTHQGSGVTGPLVGSSAPPHHRSPTTLVDRRNRQPRGAEEKQPPAERKQAPVFHCPWISCHERFYNLLELRLHSSTHTRFFCPHVGCNQYFGETEEWDEHLQVPHHNLLDTRIRYSREIEA